MSDDKFAQGCGTFLIIGGFLFPPLWMFALLFWLLGLGRQEE